MKYREMKTTKSKKTKVLFVSLGCDKNLIDSEEMLGALSDSAYLATNEEEEAKAAVVNTCCFIDDAKKESIDAILTLAEKKRSGSLKAIVVAGCLAQRYREEILTEIPEVDAVVGTAAKDMIVKALDEALSRRKKKTQVFLQAGEEGTRRLKRAQTGSTHSAYLKIAEGCDKHCTYCVIPSVRGPYTSVPMERVMEEARELVRQGAKELILIAQEVTRYGTDLYGEKKLPELLNMLSLIKDLKWIRLLYCYPEEITQELIDTMRDNKKVLHYIDMPIQHSEDRILKLMGRRTSGKDIERIVRRLRKEIPDICIRTTLIAGFPTETEEEHERELLFIRKMKFDRLGVFAYSREDGTPATRLKPQIPSRTKKKRRDELMEAQQEIAFRKAKKRRGTVLSAMVEGAIPEEDVYVCRTYLDAPEVDGLLFLSTEKSLESGDFLDVRITGAHGYDLIGEEDVKKNESAQ